MENLFECRANFYEGPKRRRIKEGYLFINSESITLKSYEEGIDQKIVISEIKDLFKEKFYTTIITYTGRIYTFWACAMKRYRVKDKIKSETLYSILSDLKSQQEANIQKTLDKLRDMLKVSTKININILGEILGIDSSTFYDNIFGLAAQLDIAVDGDYLIINKISFSDFINALNDNFKLELELIRDKELICTYCGYPLKLNEEFCNNCGTKIETHE